MNVNNMPTQLFAAAAMAALLAACAGPTKPEDALQDFFKLVEKADYDKAMRMIDPKLMSMLPEQKVRAGLEGMRNTAQQCDGFKSIEPKLSGDGNKRTGTVVLTNSSSKCPATTRRIEMSQIDGKWLLLL